MKSAFYLFFTSIILLPSIIVAQSTKGSGDGTIGGANPTNTTGGWWWFWFVMLAVLIALVVWSVMKPGATKGGRKSVPPNSRPGMQGR